MIGRPRDRVVLRFWAFAFSVGLWACGNFPGLVQPEGSGWSAERRARELVRLSTAAGTDFGSAAGKPSVSRPSSESPTSSSPLDLQTALRLAASRNRSILEGREQLEIARERVIETWGRLLPTLSGSGRYTWYSDPLRNRLPAGGAAAAAFPSTFTVREPELGVVNGTVTWPLDVSGELRHTLAAAQAGYRGEQARLWATTLAAQASVVRSYFQLLEAERLREVAEQTVTLHRQQLADAENRFQAGRLTKNERLVVQVALRDSEQQLRLRDLAVDRSRWDLNQAIGIEVNAPTRIADVRQLPAVPNSDEALGAAYDKNPLIRSLLEEQQRFEEAAVALERSRFPRFSGGGAIDDSSSDLLQPQRIESGFVGFTWDFGLEREARIAEARTAADQNRTRIERQLREIEAAVRFTGEAARERLAAFAAAEAAVGQAEENLRIRREQFLAGRATSENVLDAEALLAAQRAALASARYQAHVRSAELRQLMGLPLESAASEPR